MAKKTKARLNGEGTIYDKTVKKTKKDGTEYTLKYKEAQIMIDGERLSKTFKTKGEAAAWLLEKRDEVNKGTYTGKQKVKFGEFAETWLSDKAREGKKHTTLTGWKQYLDNHILPVFANAPLKEITTTRLNKFYDDKLKIASGKKRDSKDEDKKSEKISPNTVIHFHRIINNILNHAVRQRLIAYNPAAACSKPKAVKADINILTIEEVRRLLDVAKLHNVKKDGTVNESLNKSYYPALLVALYSGCRRSEFLGLRWSNVDFNVGTITICETLLQSTDNKIYQEDDTKSYAGKRTIAMPAEVMEVLRQHKGETDYVFANRNGERPDPHNFNRWFAKLLPKAGIEKHVRVHDLRHTNVSLLVNAGVNPKDISTRIGHANYSFTMQTYAHIMPHTEFETANKLSALLENKAEEGD